MGSERTLGERLMFILYTQVPRALEIETLLRKHSGFLLGLNLDLPGHSDEPLAVALPH
jgi:hypothetical protein